MFTLSALKWSRIVATRFDLRMSYVIIILLFIIGDFFLYASHAPRDPSLPNILTLFKLHVLNLNSLVISNDLGITSIPVGFPFGMTSLQNFDIYAPNLVQIDYNSFKSNSPLISLRTGGSPLNSVVPLASSITFRRLTTISHGFTLSAPLTLAFHQDYFPALLSIEIGSTGNNKITTPLAAVINSSSITQVTWYVMKGGREGGGGGGRGSVVL
ncbi:hypothetical protein DFA_09705 [Cavenderia fasciculata]|uniref:Uncharacterized protein n=1 Tax=Cavenderia fasciculata TaxID=261658 RepID=F4Q8D3_CACFS|nr:uncharacterized protein DFA_09705 [Cavenderia fasciculata]EGG16033.1 hypothetical protein DFA_09705 [Cavenderia fasciculata]|eukprot:XP_004352358.1 hypothetical protein DFA_09705 [Cavenderia fasciculata]